MQYMRSTDGYTAQNGVLKNDRLAVSAAQANTKQIFRFKWEQEDTFNSEASLARMKAWLLERYQAPERWLEQLSAIERPVVLDAGCGAGMSGLEYWSPVLDRIRYVGVDISEAVDIAKRRFEEHGYRDGVYIQDSIDSVPLEDQVFDVIFSEGVLHHTDDTERTFRHLCGSLKPGGLFMFYVYRKKGPIREFTDDYLRETLQGMTPDEAWQSLQGLTRLGIALGELDVEIEVPEDVTLLGIPAGRITLQRLFYWHVFKAFYDPKLSFAEMHHINFDWYAPKNAHRHTVEEVRGWCADAGLEILHEREELAGITCVARKLV